MKISRFSVSGTQVPRVTFMNGYGHKIVIQGAIHVASRDYYEMVKDLIEGFEGEVHFEGILPLEEHKPQLQAMGLSYTVLANMASLTMQSEVVGKDYILSKPEKYKKYDVNSGAVDSFLKSDKFRKMIESTTEINVDLISGKFLTSLYRSPAMNLLMAYASVAKSDSFDDGVVLDNRNAFAIDKALSTDADVFMFWGAKHLTGMRKLLFEAGYHVVDTVWDTAIPYFKRDFNESNVSNIISAKLKIESIVASDEWERVFSV